MRKIEAIIEPSDIDTVKEALGIRAVFTVAQVHGNATGVHLVHRGQRFERPYVTEAKVEMMVADEAAQKFVTILQRVAKTDETGRTRVFVYSPDAQRGMWRKAVV